MLKPLYTNYISSQYVLPNAHINNLDAQSICQICLLLFGYKVTCPITLLKKYVYLLRAKTGTKCDLTKRGFKFLSLHATLGEANKLSNSLCKP